MLINIVVVFMTLLGCCSLALDIGLIEMKRLQMQNAADAAASGALVERERGGTNWQSAGLSDAGLNGFVNGTGNVSVSLVTPPSSGAFAGDAGAVQATVSQPVGTLFMGQTVNVQAKATSHLPPCGYFLNASASYSSINLLNSTLTATCPVYAAQNLSLDASSGVTAQDLYVQGSPSLSNLTGLISPGATFGYPTVADPLAYLTSPSFSMPCNFLNLSLGILNTHTILSTPLNPGVYCGGLTLLWTTVTLNPGLYVIAGGLNWVSSTVNGSGVTLYMTKGGIFGYGQVIVAGNIPLLGGPTTVNLSAPSTVSSTGGVPGVLLFGDRNWINTTNDDVRLTNCAFTGDGILYFPRTGVSATSCTISTPNYFGMVVDNLQESSASIRLSSNFSFVPGGNPFHPRESLAE